MRYEIYLDTIVLIQFVMDYCVLMLTASVMKLKASRLRILVAAFAGAFGSCLMFLPIGLNGYLKIFLILLGIGLIMTGIAFRVRGKRQYLCMLLAIVTATFLMGGITQWLMTMLGDQVPTVVWLTLLLLIYGILQYGLRQYRKQKSLFVPVTITIFEEDISKQISIVALKDTGNRLREEKTGKAVCILEENIVCMSKEKGEQVSQNGLDTLKKYQVSYHSLGNEKDKMEACIIPKMVIHTKEGDVTAKDVMLAFYPGRISRKGGYHMILHPEYLKED